MRHHRRSTHRPSRPPRALCAVAAACALLIAPALACDAPSSSPSTPSSPPSPEQRATAREAGLAQLDALGASPRRMETWSQAPPGRFLMGSPPDEPCRDSDETQHNVTLTHGLQASSYEITQGQFAARMGYNPAFHATCGPDCPVEWVTWHEAAAFCDRLSRAHDLPSCYRCAPEGPDVRCRLTRAPERCAGYRLPTEAEWEYLARAGTTSALSTGPIAACMVRDASSDKAAWYKVNSGGKPHPVGQLQPNAWGLYDMHGNVYEWTHDRYSEDLSARAVTNPVGPGSGESRVFRGGAWYYNAEHARSANRERFRPDKRFTFVGFRCVRTLTSPPPSSP